MEGSSNARFQDLGESVPQVTFEDMKNYFLPKLNRVSFKATKSLLIKKQHLLKDGQWKEFSKMLPAEDKKGETEAFEPLKRIFEQVIECGQASSKTNEEATLFYVHAGNSAPLSERTNTGHPAGYCVLQKSNPISTTSARNTYNPQNNNQQMSDEWFDVPCTDELKKEEGEKYMNDNAIKILCNMQHAMRIDPRRRFTFGFTIENTATRIWFCCRQVVVVSEAFDFMKDSDNLLYFILSMCFASTTELGYDPTVTLMHINDKWQYDFEVGENIYRTTEELSTIAANVLYGRATRVYKAKKLHSGNMVGDEVALKDSWCDWKRRSEKKILDDVLNNSTPEEKKYFLTVVEEKDVEINHKADDTEKLIMRRFDFGGDSGTVYTKFILPRQADEMQTSKSTAISEALPSCSNLVPTFEGHPFQFRRKIHRRTVFKEVGVPIYKLTSTKEIFTALSHVVKALEIMYKNRYVHRDVSIGNILVVNGQGKLSDLENAKVMGTEASHNVRTGTMNFISIEVESGVYRYVTDTTAKASRKKKLPPFNYNPLHDLESVWWIALWSFFYKIPVDGVNDEEKQKMQAMVAFPQTVNSRRRSDSFEKTRQFVNLTTEMYFEDWVEEVLDPFRVKLIEQYVKAEEKLGGRGIEASFFVGLHKSFQECLQIGMRMQNLKLKDFDMRKKRLATDSGHLEASSSKKAKKRRT